MTSEVALLNRSAVALAADSALTVSYWNRQKALYETRYFETANKIFQLSANQPVAAMIYATADLQGAPWELLIKSYRDNLGANAHDELPAYATGLFDYITSNSHIFSADFQEKQFKSDVDLTAARIFGLIIRHADFAGAADDAAALEVFQRELAAEVAKIDSSAFLANAGQKDIDDALAKFKGVMADAFKNDPYYSAHGAKVDYDSLANASIRGLFKFDYTTLRNSCIVIAGFGANDYFPRLEAYECYGLVLGKLLWQSQQNKSFQISQTNSSEIIPFAQDEMIRTFIYGMPVSWFSKINREFSKVQDALIDNLVKAGLASDVSGDPAQTKVLDDLKEKARDDLSDALVQEFIASHSNPLRQVIGMLSFSELAELAETLISIESLKERVTRPSESVGGPIDVAIVSKIDGFIWIKRKHYFDPRLNPRYFATRGMQRSTP